jgi:hypothetical protein
MRLLTYQMPDELMAIASQGEFDEFDLNEFFEATGNGSERRVQAQERRAEVARHHPRRAHADPGRARSSSGTAPPFPYSDVRLLPYLQHSFWFLPNVAACHAMANLLGREAERVLARLRSAHVAGRPAGIGLDALPPVRKAIGSGSTPRRSRLSCGKLTTGVTVPQWSSILMLRNLKSPETYFQAAFRVQSPWSIKNPNGDDPTRRRSSSPSASCSTSPRRGRCARSPTTAGLSPNEPNPEKAVEELVKFLPCSPTTART